MTRPVIRPRPQTRRRPDPIRSGGRSIGSRLRVACVLLVSCAAFGPGQAAAAAPAFTAWLGAPARVIVAPIYVQASPDIVLGAGELTATVHILEPQAGGQVDFRLYGPDDVSCQNTPRFQAPSVPYPLEATSVASPPFTPTLNGRYRWRAFYRAGESSLASGCNFGPSSTAVRRDATSGDVTGAVLDKAAGTLGGSSATRQAPPSFFPTLDAHPAVASPRARDRG
jgi:hypothetical protein